MNLRFCLDLEGHVNILLQQILGTSAVRVTTDTPEIR